MVIPSLFYHNSEQFIGPASPFLGCKKYSRLFFPNTKCMSKNKQFYGIDISKDVFDVLTDPEQVIIDFEESRVVDMSAIEALNRITERYHKVMVNKI